MTRLARCFPLQHANGTTVTADYALQLVRIAMFDEVVENLQDTAGTGIKRALREHLIPAAHAVLDQELFVHGPHAPEASR